MKDKEPKEKRREYPVRTPPNYLLDNAPRSKAYLEATKHLTLVLETDGVGVVLH
jgi:hypothetical protein